ncbi:MAG: carboxypeptidase regulatory-like domain-containing protein [Blastocatellia bacterium]
MQRNFPRNVLLVCTMLLCACAFIQAQTVTGSISGTVRDASGALISNASIKLTQTATGATREGVTNDKGDFVFSAVVNGEYTLTVSATGFKNAERRGVVLTSAEYKSVGEITLEVGGVGETVTITAQSEQVQTASAERSGTITSDQVDNLLILGRNVKSLAALLPGVVETSDDEGLTRSYNLNVQGNRNNTNSVSLDGITLNALGNNNNGVVTVSQDAVAEVKVQLSNYQAEYGRMSGANITIITKSGTRRFHGGGSYFKRHEQFNSNNFFSNRSNLQRPRYRYNVWNYNIGGPVVIPGTGFNKNRDKLFFFFNQEWWPLEVPQTIRQVTVPTALERAGDFSQTTDVNGAKVYIRDPLKTGACNATSQAGCFDNQIIPQNRLDANGLALLKLMPLPNFTDIAITGRRYNYVSEQTNNTLQRVETVKLDFHPNANNHIAFTHSGNLDRQTGYYGIGAGGSATIPFLRQTFITDGKVWSGRYQRIFSPTLVNEFTMGFSNRPEKFDYPEDEFNSRVSRNGVGFRLGQFNPSANPLGVVPNATFGGVSQAATFNLEGRFPFFGDHKILTISDNITSTRGAHTLKAGVYIDHIWRNASNPVTFNGAFDFAQNANNPFNTQHAFANAAAGYFNSYSEATSRPFPYYRVRNVEWFVQDNWKVNRRLVLDYGMRFARITPLVERDDRVSSFILSNFNVTQAARLITPTRVNNVRVGIDPVTNVTYPAAFIGALTPGSNPTNGMTIPDNDNVPRSFIPNRGVHFGPRVGFAYDLTGQGKMSVRGGFGMFYNRQNLDSVLNPFSTQPPLVRTPVVQFGTLPTLLTTTGLNQPQGVLGLDGIGKVPTVMNFSLSVQRNIGFKTIIDVGYAGSLGRHLMWQRDINAVPLGANFNPANRDTSQTNNVPLPANFLRPIRGYAAINIREFASSSNYHSLQVKLDRRMSKSLQFGGAWTWSKSLNYNSGDGNNVTTLAPIRVFNYGLSDFDRTHVVKINYLWTLPSSRWKNPFAEYVLNGWQMSGITSFVSGVPTAVSFSLVSGIDITGSASITARPDVIANPVLPKGDRTFSRNFNTAAYRAPAQGTLGTAAPTQLRGPGINNHDIAFFKNFRFIEKMNLQFRGELYNAFNHTQFSAYDTAARFDANNNQINTRLGEFTTARRARVMQFALKLQF